LREEGALLAGAFGDGDGEKGGRIVGSLDGTAFLFGSHASKRGMVLVPVAWGGVGPP